MQLPLGHSQWKELTLSMHLPWLRQGWEAQSSVLIWQNTPSYPTDKVFAKMVRTDKIVTVYLMKHTKNLHFGTVLTWHTNAMKTTNLVKARGIVLARVRLALVYVHFTSWSLIALEALALE